MKKLKEALARLAQFEEEAAPGLRKKEAEIEAEITQLTRQSASGEGDRAALRMKVEQRKYDLDETRMRIVLAHERNGEVLKSLSPICNEAAQELNELTTKGLAKLKTRFKRTLGPFTASNDTAEDLTDNWFSQLHCVLFVEGLRYRLDEAKSVLWSRGEIQRCQLILQLWDQWNKSEAAKLAAANDSDFAVIIANGLKSLKDKVASLVL